MAKASASTALATATASMSDNAGALAGSANSDRTLPSREPESLMLLSNSRGLSRSVSRAVEIDSAKRGDNRPTGKRTVSHGRNNARKDPCKAVRVEATAHISARDGGPAHARRHRRMQGTVGCRLDRAARQFSPPGGQLATQ